MFICFSIYWFIVFICLWILLVIVWFNKVIFVNCLNIVCSRYGSTITTGLWYCKSFYGYVGEAKYSLSHFSNSLLWNSLLVSLKRLIVTIQFRLASFFVDQHPTHSKIKILLQLKTFRVKINLRSVWSLFVINVCATSPIPFMNCCLNVYRHLPKRLVFYFRTTCPDTWARWLTTSMVKTGCHGLT